MNIKTYGIGDGDSKKITHSKLVEDIQLKGYSVMNQLLEPADCERYISLLQNEYSRQVNVIGIEKLKAINEENLVRMPFLEQWDLSSLFLNDKVNSVIKELLGPNYHLHLQNAVLNVPEKVHHQTSWHRDIPYQEWTSSAPLGLNAFYCLTDFSSENGATLLLPYSHKIEKFPSKDFVNDNSVQIIAKAGSVIFFDSMLFHAASENRTSETRIGVNNMFVRPFIKQQIDIPKALKNKPKLNSIERMILGMSFEVPKSVDEYRTKRMKKL